MDRKGRVWVPEPVLSSDIEDCLRTLLSLEGFSLTPKRAHGETGVDIIASKDNHSHYIEVIGYKGSPPARAKDFYEGFFRTVSRLNDGARSCVLALSHRACKGLPARAGQHREAWKRIADAFPELEIWLVDTEKDIYRRSSWGEWAER